MHRQLLCVADRTRRQILAMLRTRPHGAGEIADRFSHVTRARVSQHLRTLLDAGFVTVENRDTKRMYQLSDQGVANFRQWFDAWWDGQPDSTYLTASTPTSAYSESNFPQPGYSEPGFTEPGFIEPNAGFVNPVQPR